VRFLNVLGMIHIYNRVMYTRGRGPGDEQHERRRWRREQRAREWGRAEPRAAAVSVLSTEARPLRGRELAREARVVRANAIHERLSREGGPDLVLALLFGRFGVACGARRRGPVGAGRGRAALRSGLATAARAAVGRRLWEQC
jgi:hypothetical protein